MVIKKLETLARELELWNPPTTIFVGNDALAFFNVRDADVAHIITSDFKPEDAGKLDGQDYNFFVEHDTSQYFKPRGHSDDLKTVSVTGPCIVFAAYTRKKFGIFEWAHSSGIYHALSLPPEEAFYERLDTLIDTIQSSSNQQVFIKAAGNNSEEKIETIRSNITNHLSGRGIPIDPEHLLLGQGHYRVTHFYPFSQKLVTQVSHAPYEKTTM